MIDMRLTTKVHRYLRKFHLNVIITGSLVLILCYVWVSIFGGSNCGILFLPSEYPHVDFIERVTKDGNENSSNYWVIRDFLVPNRTDQADVPTKDEVTIVTQTTYVNLKSLESLAVAWDGPISVAVFVRQGEAEGALKRILKYHHHNEKIKASASFHLVLRKSVPFTNGKEHKVVAEHLKGKGDEMSDGSTDDSTYPINLLRNVALSSVVDGYVFLVDITMVPSLGLHAGFLDHLKELDSNQKLRTAFVIPAFEAESDLSIPSNKRELPELVSDGHVRTYDQMTCLSCQKDTDYDKWLSLEAGSTTKNYTIQRTSPSYQPFYLLYSKVYPSFDERFNSCGKSRMSQVCEVYLSGVDFVVLTEYFLTHRGFRTTRDIHCPGNDILYEKFQEERMKKYRHNRLKRKC